MIPGNTERPATSSTSVPRVTGTADALPSATLRPLSITSVPLASGSPPSPSMTMPPTRAVRPCSLGIGVMDKVGAAPLGQFTQVVELDIDVGIIRWRHAGREPSRAEAERLRTLDVVTQIVAHKQRVLGLGAEPGQRFSEHARMRLQPAEFA